MKIEELCSCPCGDSLDWIGRTRRGRSPEGERKRNGDGRTRGNRIGRTMKPTQLAKQLSNPVAALISVPFQANEDFNIGPANGYRFTLNIQPVIPISISKDWNLILRTILPVISQTDVFGKSGTQSGLGNTTQSFFLSPKAPGPGGLIWGLGSGRLLSNRYRQPSRAGKVGPRADVRRARPKGRLDHRHPRQPDLESWRRSQ